MYITGYDLNEQNCRLAEKMNIIDECLPSFEKEAAASDLIILACPVEEVEQKICQLAELPLKPEAIITDVGSTKVKIMEKSAVLREKALFSSAAILWPAPINPGLEAPGGICLRMLFIY